jgi:hypothetical protein
MPDSTSKEPVLGRGLRLLISGAGSSTNTFVAEPDKRRVSRMAMYDV